MNIPPQELGSQVYFATGNTHPELAAGIASEMGIALRGVELYAHANTELYARFLESVRGSHAIIFQPHGHTPNQSVNDSFHQHLVMINAAHLASADTITAVSPSISGARQDKKTKSRESVTIGLNLRLMETAGANRIVTVDLHSPQSLAAFRGQYDHLSAQPLLQQALMAEMTDDLNSYVVVAPDVGHAVMADKIAVDMNLGMIPIPKRRGPDRTVTRSKDKVEGVKDKTVFMFDDMIDTGTTMITAAKLLRYSGAGRILVAATHGWFSEDAAQKLNQAPIDGIVVTNTLPISQDVRAELGDKLHVVSVAPIIGAALTNIVTGGSVSGIYGQTVTR